MECKTKDTKTRYQNIKIENIRTILKHWNKSNSFLAKKLNYQFLQYAITRDK